MTGCRECDEGWVDGVEDGKDKLFPCPACRGTVHDVHEYSDTYAGLGEVVLGDSVLLPPLESLPWALAEMVRDVSRTTQAPTDLAAMCVIGAAAILTKGRARVRVSEGWDEPCNLFLAAVAHSGAAKSPILKAAMEPVHDIEDRWRDRFKAKKVAAIAESERLEAELRMARADDNFQRIAELQLKQSEHLIPAEPQFYAEDITPEATAELMYRQNGRISIASSEGGPLSHPDRYAPKGGPAKIEVYLQAWSQDQVRVNRKGADEPTIIKAPSMTMLVMCQPVVIDAMTRDVDLAGRGLPQRFMYARPADSSVGYRDRLKKLDADLAVRQSYRLALVDLDDRLGEKEVELVLSERAHAEWSLWRQGIEDRRRPGGDLATDALTQWSAKAEASVVRLAGIFELIEGDGISGNCGNGVMEKAIAWGDYWVSNAEAIFGRPPIDHLAVAIKGVLDGELRAGNDDWKGLTNELLDASCRLVDPELLPSNEKALGRKLAVPTFVKNLQDQYGVRLVRRRMGQGTEISLRPNTIATNATNATYSVQNDGISGISGISGKTFAEHR